MSSTLELEEEHPMGLIAVDARMFDPERRPDAIAEANVAQGSPLTEDQVEALSGALDSFFPEAPDDVADYLDATATYFAMLAVSSMAVQSSIAQIASLGASAADLQALEARVEALEA